MAVQTPTIADFFADSGTRGDGVTDADVLKLWGNAGANTTVTIYDGTTRLGTTTTNSSGSWTFATPELTDSTHSFTATATDGSGTTSPASAAMSVTVVPSVTHFVAGTDNWSNPTVIDGQGWYNENAGKSWSLTEPDTHTVRMEVRAGDYWVNGDSSSRSEILAANSVSNGQIFNASYSMTIEPGTSNVNSGLSWLSLTQMYGADGATFSIQLQGEKMAVLVNLNKADQKQVFTDSSPILRGHSYDIQIQARFATDSTGYLEMWRDGVQIVDYHGVLGDSGSKYNLKLGIYRGDPSVANYTMAADYSNIVTSTDPAFPTPPFGGAGTPATASPTISSFSNDSNVVGDGITNDNTLTLTGTGSAGNAIQVYDGAALLGSAVANSSGVWNLTTGTLANGKHSLSATATSGGNTSPSSQPLSVTVDTVAPAVPVIASSSPQAGQPSVLTLSGSAEAGSKVKVFDGTTLLGSATANASAAWSFTTGALSNATHQFTTTAMDAAGNTSAASSALNVTVNAQSAGLTVSSVSASGTGITAGNGDLAAGKTVTLQLNLTGAATVAGGIPTLKLNDGGTATYTGGSGTNALTFVYTVAAAQNTADLAVTAVNPGAATIKDAAGNAVNLAGAVANPAGVLQIDTAKPSVASVVASGTGITAGTGQLEGGNLVKLTLNFSEAVTVAGGTPTLTLNDGGKATYIGGSGTNALTFSYKVAAGQNTADLAVTAVNLRRTTIKDGAGNIAALSGAVTNPAGILQIATTAPLVVGIGQTTELTGSYSGTVTFAGATGTLKIDNSASFSGHIGGQLAKGDAIDLADVTAGAKATIGYSGNNSPGTLTVSDGIHTASIALLGNYTLADFTASSDGHGGTLVVDPPQPAASGVASLSNNLTSHPVDALAAFDRQLALLSQHMASAFPSSAFHDGFTSVVGAALGDGQPSQLVRPVTNPQQSRSAV